jgi:hypothetical protein
MSNITNESHVKDVCKLGQGGHCCSYLGAGADGWECLKESSLKSTIDARRSAGTMNAKGDNCGGFDAFVEKEGVR